MIYLELNRLCQMCILHAPYTPYLFLRESKYWMKMLNGDIVKHAENVANIRAHNRTCLWYMHVYVNNKSVTLYDGISNMHTQLVVNMLCTISIILFQKYVHSV